MTVRLTAQQTRHSSGNDGEQAEPDGRRVMPARRFSGIGSAFGRPTRLWPGGTATGRGERRLVPFKDFIELGMLFPKA